MTNDSEALKLYTSVPDENLAYDDSVRSDNFYHNFSLASGRKFTVVRRFELENPEQSPLEVAMSWQNTVLGLLAVFSFFVNLSTCIVHLRFRGRRSNFSSVILAISTLDIAYVIGQFALSVINFADQSSLHETGICTIGSISCRLYVLFPLFFILIQSSFLTVGSFNRWLAIAKPNIPVWSKGRTFLLALMFSTLVVTVTVGINVFRDDIILTRPYEPKALSVITVRPVNGSNKSTLELPGQPEVDYRKNENKTFLVTYLKYGCTIRPSGLADGIVTGVVVIDFIFFTTAAVFLSITWLHIWSVPTFQNAEGNLTLLNRLRRKPEFVNSKLVDGYKIMLTIVVTWHVSSICALILIFAPLNNLLDGSCILRRFIANLLLMLPTIIKFFVYFLFSYTFRRAILETFVGPCVSRFYRTQTYVVAQGSLFDRHTRIGVGTVGRSSELQEININNLHQHIRHAHSRHLKQNDKMFPDTFNGFALPSIIFQPDENSQATAARTKASNAYTAKTSEEPEGRSPNGKVKGGKSKSDKRGNKEAGKNAEELEDMGDSSSSEYGSEDLIFTSLADFYVGAGSSSHKRMSSSRRIPIMIDDGGDMATGNHIRVAKPSHYQSSPQSINKSNKSLEFAEVETIQVSPQPTVVSIASEEENKF